MELLELKLTGRVGNDILNALKKSLCLSVPWSECESCHFCRLRSRRTISNEEIRRVVTAVCRKAGVQLVLDELPFTLEGYFYHPEIPIVVRIYISNYTSTCKNMVVRMDAEELVEAQLLTKAA